MHVSLEPDTQLTAALRALRDQSGLTLRQLESVANASDSALSRYLSGRTLPPWPVVEALCRAAGREPRSLRSLWLEAERGRRRPHTTLALRSLPRGVGVFVGRSREVRELLALRGVAAVDGMVGVGKTTLALHVGHALADEYPDGQLYVSMRGQALISGVDPLAPMLRRLLLLLGLPAHRIPEEAESMAAVWRAELARRRMLVVLDDVRSADQASPLLPGANGSGALVVGSRRLHGLHHLPTLTLGLPEAEEGEQMFLSTPLDEKGKAEALNTSRVREIVTLCGGLPLALRLAATRLQHRPGWTLAHLLALLADPGRRFAALDHGSGELRTALESSTCDLDDGAARLFRMLALAGGDAIDVRSAAALAGTDLLTADRQLETLLDAHLLAQIDSDRCELHPVLAAYASQLLARANADEVRSARRRLAAQAGRKWAVT